MLEKLGLGLRFALRGSTASGIRDGHVRLGKVRAFLSGSGSYVHTYIDSCIRIPVQVYVSACVSIYAHT